MRVRFFQILCVCVCLCIRIRSRVSVAVKTLDEMLNGHLKEAKDVS